MKMEVRGWKQSRGHKTLNVERLRAQEGDNGEIPQSGATLSWLRYGVSSHGLTRRSVGLWRGHWMAKAERSPDGESRKVPGW